MKVQYLKRMSRLLLIPGSHGLLKPPVRLALLSVALLLMLVAAAALPSAPARAAGPSANVAYVFDSTMGTGLGGFPLDIFQNAITGTQCASPCTYTGVAPSVKLTNVPLSTINVNPAVLAPYDTMVLYETCKIGDPANAAAKNAINAFVNSHKVLIFTADACATGAFGLADYSGFQFPFTTTGPGPSGPTNNYTFVEASTLTTPLTLGSCPPANNYGPCGDAVGDSNVLVTQDPAWCLSIAGTNDLPATGPIQAYARANGGGLAIYEGEDFFATNSPPAHLKTVFDNMLAQNWNPDGLPCTTPVAPAPPVTTCSITINKHSNPAGGTGFVFHSLLPALDNITLNDGQGVSVLVPCGFNLSVYEAPTPGWTLTNISCAFTNTGLTGSFNILPHDFSSNTPGFQAGDDAVGFAMFAGAHLECTFTNTAPCAASGGLDISTGTHGIGGVDPIWTVSAAPALVPNLPNAYGVSRPSSWVPPDSPANWIDPNNTGGSASDPGGDYVYETSFFVPAGAPSLVVNFNFAVDNDVLFSLTDTMSSHLIESLTALPATPAGHFNMLHPVSYSLPGPLPAGTYTLVAKVTNASGSYPGSGNPVGLLVEGGVSCAGTSVGGVAALTVSSSGSPVPWTPLAAVAASVMAVMGAGLWYARRRWLR